MTKLSRHVNTPRAYDLDLPGRGTLQKGLYIGFVKSVVDGDYMGRLMVWIPELSGDPTDENGWFLMNYCTPFGGATNYLDNKNTQNYQDSQTSYGFWFVPPDVNNEVVCAFINGDPARGIWLGCLYQQFMNNMVPGIPGQNGTATLPTVEYNKNLTQTNLQNPTRPEFTPLASALVTQGLDQDTIRGVSDTSARRANPSNTAYGILTPGSSQFVMDDNPSNTYIRLRTIHGTGFLINDTVDTIYAITGSGMAWVSMDSNGRIDIYGAEDISLRAQGSMNLRADMDVNIEAGNNINIKARGDRTTASTPSSSPVAPLPSTQPGPSDIIGDDIAVGLSSKIGGAVSAATVGATSSTIAASITTNTGLKNALNAVISAGSNDDTSTSQGQTLLASNLGNIKSYVNATNFVWILPYDPIKKGIVQTAAAGGKTIDLSNYPTNDNIHPRSYEVVGNDVQQLFITAPTNITSPPATTSSGGNVSTGSGNALISTPSTPASTPQIVDTPAQSSGNVSTAPTTAAATGTGSATAQDYTVIAANFLIPYEGHAKGGYGSYPDPGDTSNPAKVTTGYGHVIKQPEYSQGFINCGPAGRVSVSQPVAGNFGAVCQMTQAQALGLLQADVPLYGGYVQNVIGSGAWQIIGPYQQAALTSYCFNCGPGGIKGLVARGLTTFIANQDIAGAANLIKTGINTAKGVVNNGLIARRAAEAQLYLQNPSAVGVTGGTVGSGGQVSGQQVSGPITIDGTQIPGSGTATQADGSIIPENTQLSGGYIRMQSRNDFHMLSQENMFLSTVLEMHRYVGTNLYDTAGNNVNRVAGGYMHESVNADIGINAGSHYILITPRVDINGPAITPGITAAQAQGPTDYQQTDAQLDSVGNIIELLTETICTNLPFHEPYDNHGGPPLQSLLNITALNTTLFNTLRDGEVFPNSTAPLNVYGTPLTGMPIGIYTGQSYNIQNQPIYNLVGDLSNIATSSATSFTVSATGQQFIQSKENGIFIVEALGNPPVKTIGYGHTLSPTEIQNNAIDIAGQSVSLSLPLTQPQVVSLFNEDLRKTVQWMTPVLGNISVTQTQFDMLASLAFDIGQNVFTNSPMTTALLAGNYQKVPNNWMQHSADANGNPLQAYVVKRRAESTQFMSSPATSITLSINSNVAIPSSSGTINVIPSQ